MDWLLWGVLLIIACLLLLIVEVFLPTAGVLGIAAAAIGLAGVACLFKVSTSWGLGGLATLMATGPTIFFYGLRIYRQTAFGKRMTSADADEVLEEERRIEADTLYARRSLIGKEGIARTELRPIGVIDIDGVRHDAVSETTLVQVGGKVRVTAVEPTSVRVRPLTQDT